MNKLQGLAVSGFLNFLNVFMMLEVKNYLASQLLDAKVQIYKGGGSLAIHSG